MEKTGVFEDGEQRGGVSCDDDDLCHDEYSIVVVVVFVNLKIAILSVVSKSPESTKKDAAVLHKPWQTSR